MKMKKFINAPETITDEELWVLARAFGVTPREGYLNS